MRFVYLFRGGEDSPEDQQEARMAKWGAWIDDLGEAFVDGAPFGEGGKILTGRDEPAKDGSFGDGMQEVGGYIIVNAESMEQAVELARGCPAYEVKGLVEIREAIEM
jgi:hypothetical protein